MEGEPAQVRMADRHEAEEVVDLALEPARRERPRREGGEPRVVGRDRDEHGGARREGGGREDVDERESPQLSRVSAAARNWQVAPSAASRSANAEISPTATRHSSASAPRAVTPVA